MNATLALQIGNTLLSPLYAFLVHRYLKAHITDLHESERNLITDTGLNATKAIHEAEDIGQKSHASAAVLASNLHAESVRLATEGKQEVTAAIEAARAKLDNIAQIDHGYTRKAIVDTADKLHKAFAATVDEAKKNNDQALRERLDKPTPQIQCKVCGFGVVRYNADGICANCQPKKR